MSTALWLFWTATMMCTLPALDAQYRLDWIEQIYTPDMNNDYVFPNVFMSSDDTKRLSD